LNCIPARSSRQGPRGSSRAFSLSI
jgi:hypothetical protein